MKRRFFTLIFIILAVMLTAEGLTGNAVAIKESYPEGYEVIKERAIQEWGTDHAMVLYEINKQCDSVLNVLGLAIAETGDLSVFMGAVEDWSASGTVLSNLEKLNSWLNGEDFYIIFTMRCDWAMVEYEYNKQMESAGAY